MEPGDRGRVLTYRPSHRECRSDRLGTAVMTTESLHDFIRHLGTASDEQLASTFSERCMAFPADADLAATLTFIRNMRDDCVYVGGASDLTMYAFAIMLADHPEDLVSADARCAERGQA